MATGHAAGTAAALAAGSDGSFRKLDVKQLQSKLLEQDAILGTGQRGEELKQALMA